LLIASKQDLVFVLEARGLFARLENTFLLHEVLITSGTDPFAKVEIVDSAAIERRRNAMIDHQCVEYEISMNKQARIASASNV
jgi:hypothetical protein